MKGRPGASPGSPCMKTLNLDDYGQSRFSEAELSQIVGWTLRANGRKKKISEKEARKYRQKFELFGYNRDDRPFVWVARLADWRRMERLFHKTGKAYSVSSQAYWDYLRSLFTNITEAVGEKAAKNFQGFLLQELPAPGSKKKVSTYLLDVHRSRDSYYDSSENAIATTHRDRKEFKDKGNDASYYWGYLSSEEEERASELRRRNDVCMKRFQMAKAAFLEAVKIRLAAWWKHHAEESGDAQWSYKYSHRKVFTAIENDGRSYGWLSGMGGQGDLVWSPDEPPIFFK